MLFLRPFLEGILKAILMAISRGLLNVISEASSKAILESISKAILKAKRLVLEAHIIISFGETKGKGKTKNSDSIFFLSPQHQKGTLL